MKQDGENSADAEGAGKDAAKDEAPTDMTSAAVAEMTRERDEALARWQRALADFQNLRRRTQSDIDSALRRSQQSLLEGLLLSIDQLELALAAPRSGQTTAQLIRGVEMTRAELLRTLAAAGVQPMATLKPGDSFDPALHQAVAGLVTSEREPGTIIEVVRLGYSWGDIVLRPAQVIVAGAAGKSGVADNDQDG